MSISPDSIVFWQLGPLSISATLIYTWLVMLLLVVSAWLITRRLQVTTAISPWQNLLEILVCAITDQIQALSGRASDQHLAFVGTLFIFIITSNLLAIVPGYVPPTASLSTTTALALCVLIAVPLFSITENGLWGYLRHYVQPSVWMLPFNMIGELSRTIALAVRLYGNVMSGTVIIGILISLMPFFFPVVIQLLGLITGVIQAYIFAVLAMVYIASASHSKPQVDKRDTPPT
jgi:F-type H+-transporting ATPase subunit a